MKMNLTVGTQVVGQAPAPAAPAVTPPGSPATQTPAKGAADVVVFVAGLSTGEAMQPNHLADLMCTEMEKLDPANPSPYVVEKVAGDTNASYLIQRPGASTPDPILQLYVLQPTGEIESTAAMSALRRVVTLAISVVVGVALLIGRGVFTKSVRKAKRGSQKWQLGFCLIGLLCIGIYLIIAVTALVQVVD